MLNCLLRPAAGRCCGRARLLLHCLEGRCVPTFFTVTNTQDSGAGSLRQAILDANAAAGADLIDFDPTIFANPQTIILTAGKMSITDVVSVLGAAAKVTIDANSQSGIFDITKPAHFVSISGMSLTNAVGSAVASDASLTLVNCAFINNRVSGSVSNDGGAVFSRGVLDIEKCVFQKNSAGSGTDSGGGAVYATATTTISHSDFSANSVSKAAFSSGGAIYCFGSLNVADSTFVGNTAAGGNDSNGGAINAGNSSTVTNCVFQDNATGPGTASGGGAIYGHGLITVVSSTFIRESAGPGTSSTGGAIKGGMLDISDCTFSGNATAPGTICGGGAVYGYAINLTNCVFNQNAAVGANSEGGAVFANTSLTIGACRFEGNCVHSGDDGGAIHSKGTLSINASSLSGNSAPLGGAITVEGSFTIIGCTLSGNSSVKGAGLDILQKSSGGLLQNCTLSGNTASGNGGGIYFGSTPGSLAIQNCTVAFNSGAAGAGLYKLTVIGTANLESSIFAKNAGNDIKGSVVSNYCLIGNTAGATITGSNNQLNLDPRLSPLGNFGGSTLTHQLFAGSPAIDKGSNSAGLTTDQRGPGFPRTLNSIPDIGATEGVSPIPLAFSTVANITTPGATSQTIVVTYSDDTAIDISSIGTGAITVSKAGTLVAVPHLVSVDTNTNGTPRVATYAFTPPGGSWDDADDGTYTVSLSANHVYDTDSPIPNAAVGGPLTTFNVAFPRTFVVDSVADENDGDTSPGHMSLREAVVLANANAPAADTITFSPTVFSSSKTINLSLGELIIADAVTIIGPAAPLTIDAGKLSRLFTIDVASQVGQPINLSGLILDNGSTIGTDGGAIYDADEALTLANVTIRNCVAFQSGGAIAIGDSAGSLTLNYCVLSGNSATASYGGAIYIVNSAPLHISATSILNNTAIGGGGGVFAEGMSTFADSTIAANKALFPSTLRGGGGLYIGGASTLRNCTISGNVSEDQGGGIFAGATVTLLNCTVAFNSANSQGGGIYGFGSFGTMTSSLVAQNFGYYKGDDISGSVNANSSLIGTTSGTGTITGLNNLLNVNPFLAPLADNGGPTMTHALLPGSPAIDAGSNPANLTNDQRGTGYRRVVGKAADIGAYEVQVPHVLSLTINDGAPQRSRVTSMRVTFDQPITFTGSPTSAFQLKRQSDNAIVTLSAALDNSGPGTIATLTFTSGPTDFGSLADGRYTLTAFASQIDAGAFDGNGDGTPGDDYVLIGTPANGLFRLFGDTDGNGAVNAADFLAFRSSFGGNSSAFDFNNSGTVDAADFVAFRSRFGSSI